MLNQVLPNGATRWLTTTAKLHHQSSSLDTKIYWKEFNGVRCVPDATMKSLRRLTMWKKDHHRHTAGSATWKHTSNVKRRDMNKYKNSRKVWCFAALGNNRSWAFSLVKSHKNNMSCVLPKVLFAGDRVLIHLSLKHYVQNYRIE